MAALLISKQLSLDRFAFLSSLILLLNFRQKFQGAINTFLAFFTTYYFSLNLLVNTFDILWNHAYKGLTYRRDDDFTSSFSYKTHQIVLIALLSFISAQFTRPSFEIFKEVPNGLAVIHMFSCALALSLGFNFLFELTSMAPQTRFKVFRVELAKVFMSVVFFYMLSFIFTSWIRQAGSSVKRALALKENKTKIQRDHYEKEKSRLIYQGYRERDIM